MDTNKTDLKIERQKFQMQKKGYEDIAAALKELKDAEPKIGGGGSVNIEVNGADTATYKGEKGDKGDKGDAGKDGINGKNGLNGKDGKDGKDGKNGEKGEQGEAGTDGINGTNGRDGQDGMNGLNGFDGKNGSPDTAEAIVRKLQSVKKEWLSIDAIKGDFNTKVSRFGGNGSANSLGSLIDVDLSSLTQDSNGRYILGSGGGGGGAVDSVNGATGVVVLDTGDVADTLNARYVTDAEKTSIGTISGKADKSGSLTQFVGNTAFRVFYSDTNGDITELALGADGTFLKSNGAGVAPSFATPAGSGDVSKVGTPVANRMAYWTGDGTLGHEAGFTYDPTTDTLIAVSFVGALTGNVTGNVSGSSGSTTGNAATVTTNANLTGHITSTGNAAVLGSFTKAQLDTAVSDGNVMYIGDAPTAHTHALAAGATDVTSSAAELNILDGATLSTTELNYVDGVTSAIQTQLDAKLALAGGTMTGNITLGENTAIALDPAGSADGKYSGITVTGVAGYAQAFGDLVYLSSVDSRWELADADAASTADRMMAMVVVAGGSDGAACTLLLQGIIRADAKFPALTIGSAVYVGETAGAIQVAIPTGADNVIRRVGYAMTADEIYFSPSQDSQITVA